MRKFNVTPFHLSELNSGLSHLHYSLEEKEMTLKEVKQLLPRHIMPVLTVAKCSSLAFYHLLNNSLTDALKQRTKAGFIEIISRLCDQLTNISNNLQYKSQGLPFNIKALFSEALLNKGFRLDRAKHTPIHLSDRENMANCYSYKVIDGDKIAVVYVAWIIGGKFKYSIHFHSSDEIITLECNQKDDLELRDQSHLYVVELEAKKGKAQDLLDNVYQYASNASEAFNFNISFSQKVYDYVARDEDLEKL